MSNTNVSKDKESINLNVISPSSAPICFRDIPILTSIADLKQKISQASPTHPAPDGQRLLYRGHVLAQASRTLKDIFTQEIINNSESLTIHLIPPLNASQTQSQSQNSTNPTAAQTPFIAHHHPQPPPQHVQQVSFSATFNGQPSALPFPPAQIFNSAPARSHQEEQAPTTASQSISIQDNPNGSQTVPDGSSPALDQHFQAHITAMQAQAHALLANQFTMMQRHAQLTGQMPGISINGQVPAANQPALSSPPLQRPPHAISGPAGQPMWSFGAPNQLGHSSQAPIAAHQTSQLSGNLAPGMAPTIGQQNRPDLAERQPPSRPPPPQQPAEGFLRTQNQSPIPPANAIGQGQPLNFSVTYPNALPGTLNSHHVPPQLQSRLRSFRTSQSNSLYLLSSPSGPQALLVSPSGLFTTPWIVPQPAVVAPPASASQLRCQPGSSYGTTSSASAGPSNQAVDSADRRPRANGPARVVAHVANAVGPPANQEQRDLGRIAAQVSSHIWTLIRLFGFIWFFSHGASTSRTVGLFLMGALVFLGQIGLFQGLWQRLRRRADEILHLGGRDPAQTIGRQRGTNTGSDGSMSTTPEETAARLLAERQQQQSNAIRNSIRRCERAAVLFFGSLAPGLAERHIQARNEAESARQRDIQEREERAKREEEARKEADALTSDDQQTGPSKAEPRVAEAKAQAPVIQV